MTQGRGAAARAVGLVLGIFALMGNAGCAPLMVETDGHEVFNPAYRGFLTWAPRDWWQRPDDVIAALEIAPGDVVADVGAGNGYFVEHLARAVGPDGHVFATDVQDVMLRDLRTLVAERTLANVDVIAGSFDDPRLPDGCCDLVFFANVYKEISERVAYLDRVRAALRPGGRVVILGFRTDIRGPGPPHLARLAATRVVAEFEQAGFRLARREDAFTRQYLLVFAEEGAQAPVASSRLQKTSGVSSPDTRRAASKPEVRAP